MLTSVKIDQLGCLLVDLRNSGIDAETGIAIGVVERALDEKLQALEKARRAMRRDQM